MTVDPVPGARERARDRRMSDRKSVIQVAGDGGRGCGLTVYRRQRGRLMLPFPVRPAVRLPMVRTPASGVR